MKQTLQLALILLSTVIILGCAEEGLGGNSSISGIVVHHEEPIPNAIVYIKYGSTELPGTDPSAYDAQTMASSTVAYAFDGLQKGSYYLYGIGYDSLIFENVVGGLYIELGKNDNFQTDLPVTE